MTYTIQFDLEIEGDEIIDDFAIARHLKNKLGNAAMDVSNVVVLDIND